MRRIAICYLTIAICAAPAQAAPLDMRIDMLTRQLERLEAERVVKMNELTKCEKEVKNFKIAGVSALGLTGVGIGINIALAGKLSAAKSGGGRGGASVDTRSPEQVSNDNKDLFAELGI
jgi:hypothetical protein